MDNEIVVQCCMCKCYPVDNTRKRWSRKAPASLGQESRISHTYCPDCLVEVYRDMEAELAPLRGLTTAIA